MPTRAVIFDLWQTLIDFPEEAGREFESRMAKLLDEDPAAFHERWVGDRPEREVGALADSLRRLGFPEESIPALVEERQEFTRTAIAPRSGAIETLRELRRRGYKLGLISVCSEDVPAVWDESPFAGLFDSTVFSARCGLLKPDAEIYLLALRELGVRPEDAVFVGDGANDELAGAERVGMRAILIHRAGEDPAWDELRDWDGPRITTIPEVLELV